MSADWKRRKDEENVDLLLRRVARADADLLTAFPRDVAAILSSTLTVSIERIEGLNERVVSKALGEHFDIDFDGRDEAPLAGFTYARGSLIVIFVNPSWGPQAERFTLGHEAGHVVVEHLPRMNQRSLFGEKGEGNFYAHRDPPGNMFLGTTGRAEIREVVANGFAAELLAPHQEVRRLLAGVADEAVRIDKVRGTFGLSKAAARIRVSELGLAKQTAGGSIFD